MLRATRVGQKAGKKHPAERTRRRSLKYPMPEFPENHDHVDPDLLAAFGTDATFSLKNIPPGKVSVSDRWAVGVRDAGTTLWLDADGNQSPRPCIVRGNPREEAERRASLWEAMALRPAESLVIEPVLTDAPQ